MSPNELVRTAWVAPASRIGGQDHLSVRAVGESLYTRLLPGISNVTDRIHCYGFYTWFVRAYEQGGYEQTVPAFKRLFRRAECLYTLLSAHHGGERGAADAGPERDEEDDPAYRHGGGLVGRNTLLKVLDDLHAGEHVDLGRYAPHDASDKRYFKHSLGGFGQYYLGPMRGLGLITGDTAHGVKWTRERGLPVAEAFTEMVGEDLGRRFMSTAFAGQITTADLVALAKFCPCHLCEAAKLRDLLLALLLGEHDDHTHDDQIEGEQSRRHTLVLLLTIAERSPQNLAWKFRTSSYAGALAHGLPWALAPELERTRQMWAIYQRHELYSIAMQGLFSVGLRRFEGRRPNRSGVHFRSVADYVAAYMDDGVGFDQAWLAREFPALVAATAAELPTLDDFEASTHEFTLAREIVELTTAKDSPESWTEAARASLRLLLTLAARGVRDQPAYGEFVHPPRYFNAYELNLHSFASHCEHTWAEMTGREWVEWLVGRGTLRVHLRVALRKLRHQRKDTFRVTMLDEGLLVEDQAPTRWTSPRIAQLGRALIDLGLLAADTGALTPLGIQVLEARRHG